MEPQKPAPTSAQEATSPESQPTEATQAVQSKSLSDNQQLQAKNKLPMWLKVVIVAGIAIILIGIVVILYLAYSDYQGNHALVNDISTTSVPLSSNVAVATHNMTYLIADQNYKGLLSITSGPVIKAKNFTPSSIQTFVESSVSIDNLKSVIASQPTAQVVTNQKVAQQYLASPYKGLDVWQYQVEYSGTSNITAIPNYFMDYVLQRDWLGKWHFIAVEGSDTKINLTFNTQS